MAVHALTARWVTTRLVEPQHTAASEEVDALNLDGVIDIHQDATRDGRAEMEA